MSDIVERLKAACVGKPAKINWPHRLLHEAADTIEALRREVEQSNEQVSFWRGAAFDRDMAITRATEAEQRADAAEKRVKELEEKFAWPTTC